MDTTALKGYFLRIQVVVSILHITHGKEMIPKTLIFALYWTIPMVMGQKWLGGTSDCWANEYIQISTASAVFDANWKRQPLKLSNFNNVFGVEIAKEDGEISFLVFKTASGGDKPRPTIKSALFGNESFELMSFKLLWENSDNKFHSLDDSITKVEIQYEFQGVDLGKQVKLVLMANIGTIENDVQDEDILPFEEFMMERLGYWGILFRISSFTFFTFCLY